MTIYSREVIDEPVKRDCETCELLHKHVGSSGFTLLIDDIRRGYTFATNPAFNYCPECGRKLK